MSKLIRRKITYALEYLSAWLFMAHVLLYLTYLEIKERALFFKFRHSRPSLYTSAQLAYLKRQTKLSQEEIIALAIRKLTEQYRHLEDSTQQSHGKPRT